MLASSAKATARATRAAEQHVVKSELRTFEATHLPVTTAAARSRAGSSGAHSDSTDDGTPAAPPTTDAPPPSGVAAARSHRTEQTRRLLGVPFTGAAVHAERSALVEGQQVHDAVAWLRECPSSTLRQLQQRVLCATETLCTQLVGMPAAARALLELSADPSTRGDSQHNGDDRDAHGAEAANAYVTPPPSLTFTEFLGTFVQDTTTAATTATSLNGVLCTGRPRPAAPLSSLHLVYGLHVVEEALRPSTSATPSAAPSATGLEEHPALMSEVVHWAHFFEDVFDKAREGLCRDPINFYVAVLLACAERGAWELVNTPDAIAEEAVRRLRLEDSSSGRRPHVCGACQAEATHLASRCRTYVHRTLRTMHYSVAAGKSGGGGGGRRGGTRFFLATPAVVWWASAFLRLFRLRTPVAATTLTTAAQQVPSPTSSASPSRPSFGDVVSTAEAYFIRDWIARAAKMDEVGFEAQAKAGGFAIPLSCATDAPVAVFGFTRENVQAAVARMSALVDASVATGAPLLVQDLLDLLQDDLPVLPYYLSFFKVD